ncbi:MAG: PKD domain-containing protein, partial [Chitinophagales bacterium]
DENGCTISTSLTVNVLTPETCSPPSSPPISIASTIDLCSQVINTQPFQLATNTEVAWFSSNDSNDTIPIAFGEEYVFEEAGKYFATNFNVFETDTCYSSGRTPFFINRAFEVENTGDHTLQQGESIQILASVVEPDENVNYSVQWEGEGLDFYNIENPTASPTTTTVYTATFTDEDGCINQTSMTVFVEGVNGGGGDCPTISVLPIPILQDIIVCEGVINNVPFIAHVPEGADGISWFSDLSSGSFIETDTAYTLITPNTTVYAAAYVIISNEDPIQLCHGEKIPFTLETASLAVNIDQDITIEEGQSTPIEITITHSNPNANYDIQWEGEVLSDYTIANPIATPTDTVNVYTATVTDEYGCIETTSMTVFVDFVCPTVNPPIPLEQNVFICQGETAVLEATSEEGTNIIWTDDLSAPLTNLPNGNTFEYFQAGTVYASSYLITSDGQFCKSEWIPFTLEEITLTASNSGDTTIVAGQSVEIFAFAESNIEGNTFSVQWEGEGLDNYTSMNPTASSTQTTTYTATFTDENECTVTTSLIVTVTTNSDECSAELTTSSGQFMNCNGGDYSLIVLDESEDENINRYQIDWGDGSIAYDESDFPVEGISHTYPIGIFTLTYTITTSNGCISTIKETINNDIADPTIGLVPPENTTTCGPIELCFELNLVENNHPSTIYEVNFGDGSEPEIYNHPPPNPICHPYDVSNCETAENGFDFSIRASNACSENEVVVTSIIIGTPPIAEFTTNSNTALIGEIMQFFNTSTNGYDTQCSSDTDYLWEFGDGQTSNEENPSYTYDTLGEYEVCLTTSNECGEDKYCQIITATTESGNCQAKLVEPLDNFTNCDEGNYSLIVFEDSQGTNINRYQIDWGDGSADYDEGSFPNDGSISHTYIFGIFTLTYTIETEGGCTSTIQETITNITNPSIGVNKPANTAGCSPQSYCFDITDIEGNHESTNYIVDFGDGTDLSFFTHQELINENSVCHVYTETSCPESFTFSIVAENDCKKSEGTASPIEIYTSPTANFEAQSSLLCVNEVITFANTTTNGFNSDCE